MTTSGQHGIRFREALLDGRADDAVSLLHTLDDAHRIELILGQALRDGRRGFSCARLFAGEGDAGLDGLVRALAYPGADSTFDDLAAAYVAERRVPDWWTPEGRPLSEEEMGELSASKPVDVRVAALLADGAAGLAILDAMATRPLFGAVNLYYRRGSIHALGPRPLLILAAVTAST